MRRKNITSELMMTYISEALLLLMKKSSFKEITIDKITKKAGVNRSTYYRHFTTKESIITFYLNSIMNKYQIQFANLKDKSYKLYLKTMFETFYKEKDKLLLIHRSNLSYLLLPVLMNQFNFNSIHNTKQYMLSYHIGGINNNLLLWFEHSMKETPIEMTKIALQIKIDKSITLFQ